MYTEIVSVIEESSVIIPAGILPSIDLEFLKTKLSNGELPSSLSYTWLDIASIEAYDKRFLFPTYLETFIGVSYITDIENRFKTVFESNSGWCYSI